jgi:hypothetical protein
MTMIMTTFYNADDKIWSVYQTQALEQILTAVWTCYRPSWNSRPLAQQLILACPLPTLMVG